MKAGNHRRVMQRLSQTIQRVTICSYAHRACMSSGFGATYNVYDLRRQEIVLEAETKDTVSSCKLKDQGILINHVERRDGCRCNATGQVRDWSDCFE